MVGPKCSSTLDEGGDEGTKLKGRLPYQVAPRRADTAAEPNGLGLAADAPVDQDQHHEDGEHIGGEHGQNGGLVQRQKVREHKISYRSVQRG